MADAPHPPPSHHLQHGSNIADAPTTPPPITLYMADTLPLTLNMTDAPAPRHITLNMADAPALPPITLNIYDFRTSTLH